ncbi:MAG: type II toxin-antitoxin system VapB family antitoxin [Acidimicrobiales bacterium]
MARQRVSTTVDGELLGSARSLRRWANDASLLDAALKALIGAHRDAEIDDAYQAYERHPLDEADEWGDLASFRAAAGSS